MGPLVRGDSPPSRTATAAFIQRLQSWVDRGFCLHGSGAGDLTLGSFAGEGEILR